MSEPTLPPDWGKITAKLHPFFRPLTEEDIKGFSREDWQLIKSEYARQFPDKANTRSNKRKRK